MKLTPRRDEVKAIVSLLESDDYDSADALAKDIIKRVADLFADREWYAYAFRFGPGSPVLTWGPLSSQVEAERLAKKAGLDGEHLMVKLYSTAALLTRIDEQEVTVGKDAGLCTTCGHPHGTHMHEKAVGKCQVEHCGCKSDTK